MEKYVTHRLSTAIGIFLMMSSMFWLAQPSWCFHADGTPRPFGGQPDATLFPAWYCIIVMAIVSYIFMVWVRTGHALT